MLRGIRSRIVMIVLLVLLPVAVLFFVSTSSQLSTAEQRLIDDQAIRVDLRAQTVEDIARQARVTVAAVSEAQEVRGGDWSAAAGFLRRLAKKQPTFETIAVLDTKGRVVASSVATSEEATFADFAWFPRVLKSNDFVVGEYLISRQSGKAALHMAFPVLDPAGKVTAVAVVTYPVDAMRDRIAEITPPSGTAIEVLDHDGRILARMPPNDRVSQGATETVAVISAAREGTVSAGLVGLDGVTRRFEFRKVLEDRASPIYLAVGYDEAAVFAPEESARRNGLLILLAVALVAAMLAWLASSRFLIGPISALVRASGRLAAGDFDAREELPRGSDEFGTLSAEFEQMAERLRIRFQDLQLARDELQAVNVQVESANLGLEAANKELEAFNYSVSHDLRAPLRSIDGFSHSVLEDHADQLDEQGRQDLRRVLAAANRMGELIDALLTLSRLTRRDIHLEDVDLSYVATQVIATLREEGPERDVEFTIEPGLRGLGDPALIAVMMENLIGNAWKFTGKTGHARIEFGRRGTNGEGAFFVRDNGAGFDPRYANKLFSAFQRLHGQDEFPGVGIGLATSARVVHRLGGTIWAEGEIGKGATFYFTLPS